MKYLLIGDPHITKDLLEEGEKFITWIIDLCKEHNARPVFTGDLYHYHGLVHVEVADFWTRAFHRIEELGQQYAIVAPGNHDCNHACTHTALISHKDHAAIAWPDPLDIKANSHKVAVMRFYREPEEFIVVANNLYKEGYRLIVCHQEFNGAQYESGFYAPKGVDPNVFPDDLHFVSGHIHIRQFLGTKVFYLGSVRQLRVNEVGEIKRVAILDTTTEPLPTFRDVDVPDTVFEPFIKYIITEENKKELKNVKDSPKSIIELRGSDDFCRKMSAKVPPSAKVQREVTDQPQTVEIRESVGMPVAFRMFANTHLKSHPEDAGRMPEVMEKIWEKCPILREGKKLDG